MLSGLKATAKDAIRSILYGRPSAIVSLADWRVRHPAEWQPAFEPDLTPRRPARRLGNSEARLEAMALAIPQMGVLTMKCGLAVERSSYCYSAKGELIRETTWRGDSLEPRRIDSVFPRFAEVKGSCLSLLSEFARFNYGHFVLDALGRVEIAREAGFPPEAIDHYYCYRPTSRSATRLLEELGVDLSKCIWADKVAGVRAERLLVTTFPGTACNYARFVPRAMRRPFETGLASEGRRIYIPRPGVRKPTNQEELKAIAVELGLEIYDFRKVEDEFAYFRTVELVVSPHGSDLSNIGACREGTKVIELVASDHIHPYFYTLSEGAGLDYGYILGRSTQERPPGTLGPSPFDFHIDPEEFRTALAGAIAELDAEVH